jgi:DNA-binding transcriptional LysR family regulator
MGSHVEIWALYHSRRLLSVKVRAFLDALQDLPRVREKHGGVRRLPTREPGPRSA